MVPAQRTCGLLTPLDAHGIGQGLGDRSSGSLKGLSLLSRRDRRDGVVLGYFL